MPAGARYRVEGAVVLRDRSNLTIQGNDALIFATTDGSGVPSTLRDWPRNRYHVEIRGGSGIVIRNLKVRGANPHAGMDDRAYVEALEAQHAFAIRGATIVVETTPEYRRGPIRVVGNTSDWAAGSPRPVIEIQRVDGVVVRDNYQPVQEWRDQTFVEACESTAIDVRDNDVPGAARESKVLDTC